MVEVMEGTYSASSIRTVIECNGQLKSIQGRHILITGASGLIGSTVAEMLFFLNREQTAGNTLFLAGRNKKRIEDRFHEWTEGEDYHFVQYDAMAGQLEQRLGDIRIDDVIHGASNSDPVSYAKSPVETMMVNLLGTREVLEYMQHSLCKRLLYISSSEVYGNRDGNSPFREEDYSYVDILDARACYPSAKRASETLCAAYREEYGMDYVIVRPGHIYGPSITETDSRASAQFSREAAAGKPIVMKSAGEQIRSYTYALDCASAILTVLIEGEAGNAYNISNPKSVVSIREMAEAFADAGNVMPTKQDATEQEKKGFNRMRSSALNADKLLALGWHALYSMKKGAEETVLEMRKGNRLA